MNNHKTSLLRSTVVVAIWHLLSRLSGFAKELFIASHFGSSATADSINIALRIPNLFRRIFGEGALAAAFVPIFSNTHLTSQEEARKFASNIFTILLLVLSIITIILEYYMPTFISLLAPGFCADAQKFALTVWLSRITLPYLVLVCLVALCGAILNSVNRFAAFAFSPVILNVAIIVFVVMRGELLSSEVALSIAVPFAGVVQLLFMLVYLRAIGVTIGLNFSRTNPNTWHMFKDMGPAVTNAGVGQISSLLSQGVASFLPGAVSILSYAEKIYQLPLVLIGSSLNMVLLPALSKLHGASDQAASTRILLNSLKVGLLLSVPCSAALISLAVPITKLLYQRAAFTTADTLLTAKVMQFFCIGLPALVICKIVVPAFYAMRQGQLLTRINFYSLICNSVLTIVLAFTMQHIGFALASCLASWFMAVLLLRANGRMIYICYRSKLAPFFIKVVMCSLVMGLVMYWIHQYLGSEGTSLLSQIYKLIIAGLGGVVIYPLSLHLVGIRRGDF